MDYTALADLLFPDISLLPEDLESRYPERSLSEGAMVTRFAPSPTGFVHFGSLFPVVTDLFMARQSGGVFYLRIEDTDQKREVPGGVMGITESLRLYEIDFDEGASETGDTGHYGPYRQRSRAEIYQTFAKKLVGEGKATHASARRMSLRICGHGMKQRRQISVLRQMGCEQRALALRK